LLRETLEDWKDRLFGVRVISNNWSEDNCGEDFKDWSATGEFNIKGIYGQGIRSEIAENAAYS
jgi:hypothetical protein